MEDRSFGWTVEMSLKAFQALLTMDTPKLVLVEVPLRGKKKESQRFGPHELVRFEHISRLDALVPRYSELEKECANLVAKMQHALQGASIGDLFTAAHRSVVDYSAGNR